ncbi:MAG: hypothetical protein ACOYM2_06915 [Rectinemataceae bacterium]
MVAATCRDRVEAFLGSENGILPLEPCYIARKGLPPGRRLGLEESAYDLGERGNIIARCLASETGINNPQGIPDQGLSFLAMPGQRITVKDAMAAAGDLVMGAERAAQGRGLNLLAKIFDFNCRLYFHVHLRESDSRLVGKNPKEEGYFFLEGPDPGPHPETFFGVHPYITREGLQEKLLLPYLEAWDSDLILKHSRAYLNVPGEGFHLPAGGLHAPGSTLTLELQEPSDTFSVFQARIGDIHIDKALLHKDIPRETWEREGESSALSLVDWELSGDPFFYENRRIAPIPINAQLASSFSESWIIYNSRKFSAKRLVVAPGGSAHSQDAGAYTLFVWRGCGQVDGHSLSAGEAGKDEYLVSQAKAMSRVEISNSGTEDLVVFKLFGAGVNPDVPFLKTMVSK